MSPAARPQAETAALAARSPPAGESQARAIYQQLIEIDTSLDHGTTQAAQAMAARLRSAGFPAEDVRLLGKNPQKLNLVARLHGSGARRPLLLLAHLDVVAAPVEEGTAEPSAGPVRSAFRLIERDGVFYGRGTLDDKAMAALWVDTLLRLRQEGFVPDRDLILALTADEEDGEDNGVLFLLAKHRPLIDAAYCLNEGGTGEMRNGRYLANEVQAGEKTEASFSIVAKGPGGNSAQPPLDENEGAVARLAAGLTRLAAYRFPLRLSELTRQYFAGAARTVDEPLQKDLLQLGRAQSESQGPGRSPVDEATLARVAAASSFYNALLRTTCVPTLISGGEGESVVPERAEATVNCRLLPDDRIAEVQKTLVRVLADPRLEVGLKWPAEPNPTSPLLPELWRAVQELTQVEWPDVPVVPLLLPAATDGRYLRAAGIPTYGVSGLFVELDESPEHSATEHLGVRQFYEGRRFLYRLIKALASPVQTSP